MVSLAKPNNERSSKERKLSRVSLKKGLADTIEWYIKEGYKGYQRYNSFKEIK